LKQNPQSVMATKWLLERGILPAKYMKTYQITIAVSKLSIK